ncbi:MAG: AI-2E family transporter [Chloroflexota bacterium]|nr:MAG: AI-2E family transporter [Chloroflexota bacterium]
MSTEWSKPTKYIVGVGLTLFGLYVLYLSQDTLTLLILAALIAFLLTPLINFMHLDLKLPRGLAVLLAYLFLVLFFLLTPLVLLPPIIDGFQVLAGIDYQILLDQALNWFKDTLLYLSTADVHIFGIPIDLSGIVNPALQNLQATGPTALKLPSLQSLIDPLSSAATITYGVATSVAGTVVTGAISIIFTLFFAIYMSIDSHKFRPWFLSLIPDPYRPELAQLLERLRRIWRAYFRGQLILMISIGMLTWVGNTILGLPGAFALAFIAGVMELIPNLGPFLAAVPAVIVALIQGSTNFDLNNFYFALIVIGFYWAVQVTENNLIVPRVLGEAVELPPLVVMIGVFIGASVAGIIGALLAAPVIASTREVLNYLWAKMLGRDPFPPQPVEIASPRPSTREQLRILLANVQKVLSSRSKLPAGEKSQAEAPENQP